MIPVAYTTFNAYFVKRRVVMMSTAQTLIGVGTMVYPILVQFLMNSYGFRGCMAILAAINGHVRRQYMRNLCFQKIMAFYHVLKLSLWFRHRDNFFYMLFLLKF